MNRFDRFLIKVLHPGLRRFGVDFIRIPESERNKFEWLKGFSIQTILDVGSNEGQFIRELYRFLPKAAYFAFEPLPDVYQTLLRKVRRMTNVRAFHTAVGDRNGRTRFQRSEFAPSSSVLEMSDVHKEAFPISRVSREEEVDIGRLDDLVREHDIELRPDVLIKLDVQGYEKHVIDGGRECLKKARVVITEVSFSELYKNQVLFVEMLGIMTECGFQYRGNINGGFHPKTGLPLYADALFVRQD